MRSPKEPSGSVTPHIALHHKVNAQRPQPLPRLAVPKGNVTSSVGGGKPASGKRLMRGAVGAVREYQAQNPKYGNPRRVAALFRNDLIYQERTPGVSNYEKGLRKFVKRAIRNTETPGEAAGWIKRTRDIYGAPKRSRKT